MGAVFALLAGIDTYASETVPDLRGCRNDVLAAAAFLRTRCTSARVLRLLDAEATRAAVVDGIHRHLGQAGRGDTAVFWFSGHGSQVPVPDGLQHLETGPMMQTLVCADSRTPGVPDLLDKELSLLLDEIAGRGAHVAVVLDSCHSEGASRLTVRVRSARPSLHAARQRPPVLLPELGGRPYDAVGRPGARHVALAAARRHELARELELDGEQRGVFSWALLRALGRLGGSATYRELLTAARVLVEARIAEQVPQLYPIEPGITDQPFLGGATRLSEGLLIRHGRDGWELDAGACHGLPLAGGELRVARAGGGELREARVTRVLTERSLVTPLGWAPDQERQYPMVFSRVPLPATTVAGVPPEEIEHSAYVRLAGPDEEPELLVVGGTRIRTPEGEVPAGPGTRLQRLEHVARWRQIRALENPRSRLAGAVALEVIPKAPGNAPINGEIRLAYENGVPPRIYLRLYNRTNRRLYCVLLNLTSGYRVYTGLFPGAFVDARSAGWALDREPVEVSVPSRPGRLGRLWGRSPGVTRDWLKLLVAEEQFSSAPFVLPAVDRLGAPHQRSIRLRGPHHREDGESAYDWTAVTVPVVTENPQ
ncbi:hypothetical protein Acy02nite_48100 [Actinoplanes cyaneus]|uniref:Peptidase C14 caspase domain-containing protein n=1 Tax=Actinoplanes cyaneus TaxID=52696 RepID=A0A919IJG9_9ACTN|nr:caspase family protein [Actinoplanes cyaneus]MCW2138746.1 Caspase domain-containing protein [Actinoplanes cyaneus]GID66929.1 hypothetical protein Acy02nite_48100 [Actinoplanes cyaneus]